MSINNIGPEEIARRKSVSDEKNDTDDLTISNNKKATNFAVKTMTKVDDMAIIRLCNSNDTSELEELFKSL